MKLNLGENIRTLRRSANMTQEQLADQLGVSFQSVSRWENGSTYPDMELLPTIARIFSVTVDSLLSVSDEERRKNFEAVRQKLQETLAADPKNEDDIVAVLRELRRDYMEFFCNDTYYFYDLRNSGAYKFPAVLDEMRLIFEEVIEKSNSNFVKGFFIEQMAEMEDENHIVPFLQHNATAADLSGDALLRKRYLFHGENDKFEELRQTHLYELLNELCNNIPTWYITGKTDYSAEYAHYVNTACFGILRSICGTTYNPAHPVTDDGTLDLFVDIRLNLGAKLVASCAGTGDIDGALTAMEDWISLFEQVMHQKDGTEFSCASPALAHFHPTISSFWMQIDWKQREERFAFLEISGEHTYANQCEKFNGSNFGLFDPSGYLYYFAPNFTGAFLRPSWLDPIRDHPRYLAALDRLNALIESRCIENL